jgi:uncharacterized repeat protein (TIGR01451 family)
VAYTAASPNYFAANDSPWPQSFEVQQADPSLSVAVLDGSNGDAWSDSEVTGAEAAGSASVGGGVPDVTPTGTVTYTAYSYQGPSSLACDFGTPIWSQTVNLAHDGSVPNSSATPPLDAGTFYIQAQYSGDANFGSQTSSCSPFTVSPATPGLNTSLTNAATGQPVTAPDGAPFADTLPTVSSGSAVYETATVASAPGIDPTGQLVFTTYSDGNCQGTGTIADESLGTQSPTDGPLSPGTYSIAAMYDDEGNDPNYTASVPICTTFAVSAPAPPATPPAGPSFSITAPNSPAPVQPGQTITYAFDVANGGGAGGTATVTDPLPSTLTVQGSPTCTVSNPTADRCDVSNPSSNTYSFALTLAPRDTATVSFVATLAATAPPTQISNTATITSGSCSGSASSADASRHSNSDASGSCAATVTTQIVAVSPPTVTPPPTPEIPLLGPPLGPLPAAPSATIVRLPVALVSPPGPALTPVSPALKAPGHRSAHGHPTSTCRAPKRSNVGHAILIALGVLTIMALAALLLALLWWISGKGRTSRARRRLFALSIAVLIFAVVGFPLATAVAPSVYPSAACNATSAIGRIESLRAGLMADALLAAAVIWYLITRRWHERTSEQLDPDM